MRTPSNAKIESALAAIALLASVVACTAGGQIIPQTPARQIESGRALPGGSPTPAPTAAPQHHAPAP
ncbi:MAG TPA: hypothetical protein VHT53_02570 [Candidatus Elarobacter sp.]|nr:hypothetical protein [Candidatus Elarobacter sp.]